MTPGGLEEVALFTFRFIILGVMLFGLAGLLTCIIPGLVIIWLAALVYALVTGFSLGNGIILGVMTLLMIGGGMMDEVMMGARARQSGAGWLSIAAALVLGLAGSLIWPPFGGLIAALAGIFVVEYIRLRNWRSALNSARGMAVGCGWATLIRLGAGMVMILLWGAWVLWL